jgi:hypothetical protein
MAPAAALYRVLALVAEALGMLLYSRDWLIASRRNSS